MIPGASPVQRISPSSSENVIVTAEFVCEREREWVCVCARACVCVCLCVCLCLCARAHGGECGMVCGPCEGGRARQRAHRVDVSECGRVQHLTRKHLVHIFTRIATKRRARCVHRAALLSDTRGGEHVHRLACVARRRGLEASSSVCARTDSGVTGISREEDE